MWPVSVKRLAGRFSILKSLARTEPQGRAPCPDGERRARGACAQQLHPCRKKKCCERGAPRRGGMVSSGVRQSGANENAPPQTLPARPPQPEDADKSPPGGAGRRDPESRGGMAAAAAHEEEDRLLEQILTHAAIAAAPGGAAPPAAPRGAEGRHWLDAGEGGAPRAPLHAPLVDVLQSYEMVLRARGRVPADDTLFYKCAPPPPPPAPPAPVRERTPGKGRPPSSAAPRTVRPARRPRSRRARRAQAAAAHEHGAWRLVGAPPPRAALVRPALAAPVAHPPVPPSPYRSPYHSPYCTVLYLPPVPSPPQPRLHPPRRL
jgi:hypothetical protein